MQRSHIVSRMLGLFAGLCLFTACWLQGSAAWAQQSGHPGVFGGLSVGQIVSAQEKQSYIQIDVISPNPQNVGSHRVVEIGADYLVIEDIMHVTRSWIPVTAIRRINLTNLGADLSKPQE
jgi:hypothetical protein